MRKILLVILIAIISGRAFAQDKIYKTNGNIILAKILSVDGSNIFYKNFDNPTGPEYTILKSDVEKVVYQSGAEETFQDPYYTDYTRKRMAFQHLDTSMKRLYKPHILALAPLQFTENGVAGISISYEAAIDRQGIAAFTLPAILEFNTSTSAQAGNSDPIFYVEPGLKIYPTGSYGLCKYAVGPSLVIGDGQKTVQTGTDINYNPVYASESHFLMGMMVNQSVNVNPTPHFYLGAEIGFGFTYVDQLGGVAQYTSFLFNFNIKLGYRF